MSGKIYVLKHDETLEALTEQPYADEDLLQTLLERYSDLLAGEEMNPGDPRRWLLVSREISVPGEEQSVGWMDHLFLDQDAVPTLVEVKRSSDTRIRREVVGQLLDYAANAVSYLPADSLRARFEAQAEQRGEDPEQLVLALLDSTLDQEEAVAAFWQQVKTNLQAGRLRLVFVADIIPAPLRRIVEFLNEQMDPAEVLAVEIRQYVGEGIRTLVPRVVGRTAEAERRKRVSTGREINQWDEAGFFQHLAAQNGAVEVRVARAILDWARRHASEVWWGKGKTMGSFVPTLYHQEQNHQLFAVYSTSALELYFQHYKGKAPFASEERREELRRRLNTIPTIRIPADGIERRPSIPLAALADEEHLQRLLAIFEWIIKTIRDHKP